MVYLDDVIRVEIKDDKELVQAFLGWQIDTGNYSIRGSSWSGLGNSLDYFDTEYRRQIEEFFDGHS